MATVANVLSPGILYVQQEPLRPSSGYVRALFNFAQREGSIFLRTKRVVKSPAGNITQECFCAFRYGGEATEEEIREFIQQTYTLVKVESEIFDTKLVY